VTNTYLSSANDVSIVICSVITNLYRSSEFANLEKYIDRKINLACDCPIVQEMALIYREVVGQILKQFKFPDWTSRLLNRECVV